MSKHVTRNRTTNSAFDMLFSLQTNGSAIEAFEKIVSSSYRDERANKSPKVQNSDDFLVSNDSIQSSAPLNPKYSIYPDHDHHLLHVHNSIEEFLHFSSVLSRPIDSLSIIHVSGTKGKGSTVAFTESILRSHGYSTGTFTSPHLEKVTERITINGNPISDSLFSSIFWGLWDKLVAAQNEHFPFLPSFFRYLALIAFEAFFREKPDVCIFEVGIGGRFDVTNIIQNPQVAGVASLGYDHQHLLGSSIDEIAWNKAGIFHSGATCITMPQPESALKVLNFEASVVKEHLYIAPPISYFPILSQQNSNSVINSLEISHPPESVKLADIIDPASSQQNLVAFLQNEKLKTQIPPCELELGIDGYSQMYNAGLAVSLANAWIKKTREAAEFPSNQEPKQSPEIETPKYSISESESESEIIQERQKPLPEKFTTLGNKIDPSIIRNLKSLISYSKDLPDWYPLFPLTEQYVSGLKNTFLPGRFFSGTIPEIPNISWSIDSGHTFNSIHTAFKWYKSSSNTKKTSIISIPSSPSHSKSQFENSQSLSKMTQDIQDAQQNQSMIPEILVLYISSNRNYNSLVLPLIDHPWTTVYLTLPDMLKKSETGSSTQLFKRLEYWKSVSSSQIKAIESVDKVITDIIDNNSHCRVFCVGSLYLTGSLLNSFSCRFSPIKKI